jgi:hypothetical protein
MDTLLFCVSEGPVTCQVHRRSNSADYFFRLQLVPSQNEDCSRSIGLRTRDPPVSASIGVAKDCTPLFYCSDRMRGFKPCLDGFLRDGFSSLRSATLPLLPFRVDRLSPVHLPDAGPLIFVRFPPRWSGALREVEAVLTTAGATGYGYGVRPSYNYARRSSGWGLKRLQ